MYLILSFLCAFIATLTATPLVRWISVRAGLVDHPDSDRKFHDAVTPLGGGIGVLLGLIVGILCLVILPGSQFEMSAGIINTLVGGALICSWGVIDDAFHLNGKKKLLGQIVCVLFMIVNGLNISAISIMGWDISLGLLAIPFTAFWLLGTTNALNLIDGMDGLATSVGIVLSLALGGMAYVSFHYEEAYIAFALAGALAAFLIFNFPPASIFLGDSGSMLIGLLLGVLAIRTSLKGPATVLMAAPIAVMAVPAFDVAMAIVRRRLAGRSIYSSDREHMHHSFLQKGFGNRQTLIMIGLMCTITAAGGFATVAWKNEYFALTSIAAVIGTLIATGVFGYRECEQLGERVFRVTSFLRIPGLKQSSNAKTSAPKTSSQKWDESKSERLNAS